MHNLSIYREPMVTLSQLVPLAQLAENQSTDTGEPLVTLLVGCPDGRERSVAFGVILRDMIQRDLEELADDMVPNRPEALAFLKGQHQSFAIA